MTVKRFSKIEEAVDSQIVFVSRSEEENLTEILKHLSQTPVLTVSDIERFAGKGGWFNWSWIKTGSILQSMWLHSSGPV